MPEGKTEGAENRPRILGSVQQGRKTEMGGLEDERMRRKGQDTGEVRRVKATDVKGGKGELMP